MRFGLPKIAFHKPLSTLLMVVCIMHLANYIIIPIFPIILSIEKGFGPAQIGYLIGIGSIAFQVGSMIGGLISDKIGRKITLVTGSIIEIIALLGFGFSNTYAHFILFQILNGIGGGVFAPTIKAAIVEYTKDKENNTTTAFSLRGMSANLGIAIGGLIPFILIGLKFSTFFFISAFFYVGLLVFSLFIPNSCEDNICGNTSIKRYISIFKNKPFILFSILTFFVWIIYAQFIILLPLRATAIFKNAKLVSSIWTISSIFVVLLQTFIATHIIQKFNLMTSIAYGALIMGAGMFLIGMSNTYVFLLLSAFIFITGEMLVTPTYDSITSELADKTVIGAYFSVANITYGLGVALGSSIGGKMISIYGINNLVPWLSIFVTSLIIAIIIYVISKKYEFKNEVQ